MIAKAALEAAIDAKSPLTLSQIEKLFGGVTPENKALVWRFLNLTHDQQIYLWQSCLVWKCAGNRFQLETII